MKKVLSEELCSELISYDGDWERVDLFGKYYQKFIDDVSFIESLQDFFGCKFAKNPIVKLIKLEQGDNIPLFSADYSKQVGDYFKRYNGTNFIIHIFLNRDYEGGEFYFKSSYIKSKIGFGIIQSKTDKCRIDKVEKGEKYMLLCFVSDLQKQSII